MNFFIYTDQDVKEMIGCTKYEACQHVNVGMHDSLKTIFSKATTKTQHQVQSRLLLDVVVRKSAAVLKLLASKNQALLIRGNAFLILNFGFDIIDRVRGFHIKGDGLASQSFHENLHFSKVFCAIPKE